MKTGRTAPILTTCSARGVEDLDVVVKLNGAMDFGHRSAVFEVVASLMASKIGIECPRPFLVWLSPEFIEAVIAMDSTKAKVLRSSVGWNFGSQLMKDATVWATGAPIGSNLLPDALRIFSFDGLIQNVDRRDTNPNLMTHAERLCVIDHELGFTFLSSVIPPKEPWTLGAGDYMERHALRRNLKGASLDWDECRKSLQLLTGSFLGEISESLPNEWAGMADMNSIREHITSVLAHITDFETELQRKIAC